MRSPRSGEPMIRMVRHGTWGWVCEQTGGVWLEVSAATQLDTDGARALAEVAASSVSSPDEDDSRIDCPACGERLRRVRWRGVRIDRCDAHGAWFDRGEIQHILGERVPPKAIQSADDPPSPGELAEEVLWLVDDVLTLLHRLGR